MSTPKHLFMVEDHVDTAEMLTLVLENEGYQVTWRASAVAALEWFERAPSQGSGFPDLILLDLMLPDMDGLALLERLRANLPQTPPVLIMSAKPIQAVEQAAREARAVGLLRKPFDVSVLLSSLDAAFGRGEPGGRYRSIQMG